MRRQRGDFGGDEGWCAAVEVEDRPKWRVSSLLGPDGEPLMLAYERHPFGFDLRPKAERGE